MEFHLLPIFAFLSLALAVSHASLPSEVYWQTALPNTPMPKAIRDLLPQPGKSTSVINFSNEELSIRKNDYGVTYNFEEKHTRKNSYGFTYSEGMSTRKHGYGFTYSEGKPTHKNGYGFTYSEKPNTTPGEQLQEDDQNVAFYFLEKDLQPGTKMKLQFTKIAKGSSFLPREVAESIPFSSNKLPEILNQFSVKPKSVEAQIMKETIGVCEGSGNVGEEKYCATSLESLINFSITEVGKGKKVQAITSEVEDGTQEYEIGEGVKMVGDNAVACHKLSYAYAVFYCHATRNTRTYMASLVDADGAKSKAVAICHVDTSTWNPKHLAFEVLKVKPGSVPICHFVPNGHIMWVSN